MAIPRLYKNRVFAPFAYTAMPAAFSGTVMVAVTVLVPVMVPVTGVLVPVMVPVTVLVPGMVSLEVLVLVVVAAQESETSSAYHISSRVSGRTV